jgi:hypothetical protein
MAECLQQFTSDLDSDPAGQKCNAFPPWVASAFSRAQWPCAFSDLPPTLTAIGMVCA